ncbi:hypothetical protein [Streptomyces melanogenes]|uniref:hypothetical protein n=1 Tax=Streptomyces melanogenes TaxID=67326 RepID=UPI00379048F2
MADVDVVEKAVPVLLVVTAVRVFAADVALWCGRLLGVGVGVGAAELTGRPRHGRLTPKQGETGSGTGAAPQPGWGTGE